MKSGPKHQLPRQAVSVWRLADGLRSIFFWLLPIGYYLTYNEFGAPFWGIYLLVAFAFLNTLLRITLIPGLRWKHWRYEVTEHEIDLKHGIFVVSRTLIPIRRVQHVDTRQDPIRRFYGIAGVRIYTAATVHEIPALEEEDAEVVRDRIAELARIADEDV
jgi:membrane protein YdbS with pleckstrin-like domain